MFLYKARALPASDDSDSMKLHKMVRTDGWPFENMRRNRSILGNLVRNIADIVYSIVLFNHQKLNTSQWNYVTARVRIGLEANTIATVGSSQTIRILHGWRQSRWSSRPDPRHITLSGESWYRYVVPSVPCVLRILATESVLLRIDYLEPEAVSIELYVDMETDSVARQAWLSQAYRVMSRVSAKWQPADYVVGTHSEPDLLTLLMWSITQLSEGPRTIRFYLRSLRESRDTEFTLADTFMNSPRYEGNAYLFLRKSTLR